MEGRVLFNDALNTFYLRLYGVRHMVKDHSDSERRKPLLPHGLLFPISSKGSFICIIPDRIMYMYIDVEHIYQLQQTGSVTMLNNVYWCRTHIPTTTNRFRNNVE